MLSCLDNPGRIVVRQMQADEVEVFELFGGGLPVPHRTVTARTKGMGDRSHKPYGPMLFCTEFFDGSIFHECAQETRKSAMVREIYGHS
ncbi:hypothetical protein [Fontibacillus sp. BL9]|uniref:hypothetical protein n=1 Tax=Fontibacillus sp. BL9 TaxID=3389971 RepID=UPI00397DF8BC